jgi:uncharacterized protein YjiS (DUF1127 family)
MSNLTQAVGQPSSNIVITRLKAYYSVLLLWHRHTTTRSHLRDLPPHLLNDVGLSEEQLRTELNKPFWG